MVDAIVSLFTNITIGVLTSFLYEDLKDHFKKDNKQH